MQGFCRKLLLFFIILTFSICGRAQESIYSEISFPFMQKLVDAAKENYPKMKTFQRKVIMAQDNVKKSNKTWFDFFSFSVNWSPTNSISISNYVLTGYQFGMGINFATFLQKPYVVKDAKNQLIISKLERDEYDLSFEVEVKSRYIKYIQELIVLKLKTKNQVDLDANFKQTKYKFEKGEESFENYNKAMVAVAETKQNVISSEGNLLIAKYSLEELIGKKLEEIR